MMKYLTKGTVRLITDIAGRKEYKNNYELLDAICEELVRRYPGDKLEYQLKRMQIETTIDILQAIEMMKNMKLI